MRNVILALCGAFLLICVLAVFLGSNKPTASTNAATQASTPAAPQSTPEQKQKAAQCGKALSHAGRAVWLDMNQSGDYVSVVAAPGFEMADYDSRKAFTALVVCYYTDGRMDDTVKIVEFLDPHTHQPFGHWYKGLELTFDR